MPSWIRDLSSYSDPESGLGLEAQRQAVAQFIGDTSLLAEFQEIESGKNHKNRPQLL